MHKLVFGQVGLIPFGSLLPSIPTRKRRAQQLQQDSSAAAPSTANHGDAGSAEPHAKRQRVEAVSGANGSTETDTTDAKLFEQYYRGKLVPPDEWPSFTATLETKLPTTFRLNGSPAKATAFRATLERRIRACFNRGGSKQTDVKVAPFPWCAIVRISELTVSLQGS